MMSDQQIAIEALKRVLADSYALYLKTQGYHWNVEGINFKALHLLFEEQYQDLAEAIDNIAERIRALGDKAPASFDAYKAVTTLSDGSEDADAITMLEDLEEDQKLIVNTLKQAFEAFRAVGDEVTMSLLIDRMTVHEKNAWMLHESTL